MRVLLADDQPQVRSALRLLLEEETDIQVVDEVTNAEDLLVQTESTVPDVLLLDWELPGLQASALLTALRQGHPYLCIIALSGEWEARRLALAAGADAFVSKAEPSDRLLSILREVKHKEDRSYEAILVPLDGSERAEAILPHVKEIAQRNGATVTLLYVVESSPAGATRPVRGVTDSGYTAQHTAKAEAYLAVCRSKLQEAGISVRSVVADGPVVQGIVDVAEREQADLIAMASRGRTGLSRALFGSVAAGVLHRIDRPMLLVRAE